MRKRYLVPIVVVALLLLAFHTIGHETPGPKPKSPTLSLDTAMNMLYDANLSNFSLKPQLTYWVDGGTCTKLSPKCRILRMEGIVEVKNRTYLAFFDLENRSVKLVPANETQVKEYLQFFEEHNGKVFPCNSPVKSTFGKDIEIKNKNGTCIAPAVVKIGGGLKGT